MALTICFAFMLLFTENNLKQSFFIAGIGAGAGLIVSIIGYNIGKRKHNRITER